jgi:hypothetical protein
MYFFEKIAKDTTKLRVKEDRTMTSKELMYLDDTLGAEQQLYIKCKDYSQMVKSPQLKNLLSTLSAKHKRQYTTLLNQLSD